MRIFITNGDSLLASNIVEKAFKTKLKFNLITNVNDIVEYDNPFGVELGCEGS